MKIDYLRAVVQFGENSDNYYHLQPAEEWGRSTAPLEEVIKYTKDPDGYVPPENEKIVFLSILIRPLQVVRCVSMFSLQPNTDRFFRKADQEVHEKFRSRSS